MPVSTHVHNHTLVVRMRGSRSRKQCPCGHIGPWVKEVRTRPHPSDAARVARAMNGGKPPYDRETLSTMTVKELRLLFSAAAAMPAKARKAELIEAIVNPE